MREGSRFQDRPHQPGSEEDDPSPGGRGSPGEDPEAKVRALVLRMLTHSPRTRAQLERALHRREFPEEVITSVLDTFGEAGLIDDATFARAWVSSRHHSRRLSRRALAQELRTRGVEEDTVQEAVGELSDQDEEEAARALARRRLANSRGKDRETRIRRALGALARKGYPSGLSYRLVREELEHESVDTDPDGPGL
ncbi:MULTISPECIES: recombination regulator RecX [Nocardiopsis]|uniref:Regulatory protein RecX n=1 Tax=Nocardiopsis sinuspersici TaxID=501010 RepID=A0A1V3BWV3_9ACTN|nr:MULTISPECIES: recombination regulator RecX [Nocardiopsis]NYH54131.1 regulatory protein [Nocardiopsis sinuspersici]OOC52965.1 recombination regulator RecX [Nocardiopsis sinuspersici]